MPMTSPKGLTTVRLMALLLLLLFVVAAAAAVAVSDVIPFEGDDALDEQFFGILGAVEGDDFAAMEVMMGIPHPDEDAVFCCHHGTAISCSFDLTAVLLASGALSSGGAVIVGVEKGIHARAGDPHDLEDVGVDAVEDGGVEH